MARSAGDYAHYVAELREDGTLHGRPVETWDVTKRDGQVYLRVRFATGVKVVYRFSAANVTALAEHAHKGTDD